MKDSNAYEVVWPRGKRAESGARLASAWIRWRQVVCELWDWISKAM